MLNMKDTAKKIATATIKGDESTAFALNYVYNMQISNKYTDERMLDGEDGKAANVKFMKEVKAFKALVASFVKELEPKKVMSKQPIYIPRGMFFELGFDSQTITRRVFDIVTHECGDMDGKVKINGKIVNVYHNVHEWFLG